MQRQVQQTFIFFKSLDFFIECENKSQMNTKLITGSASSVFPRGKDRNLAFFMMNVL